jgi:hypothetical protein
MEVEGSVDTAEHFIIWSRRIFSCCSCCIVRTGQREDMDMVLSVEPGKDGGRESSGTTSPEIPAIDTLSIVPCGLALQKK